MMGLSELEQLLLLQWHPESEKQQHVLYRKMVMPLLRLMYLSLLITLSFWNKGSSLCEGMGEGCCTQPYPCICKEAVSGFEPMTNKSPRHNFTAAPGLALPVLIDRAGDGEGGIEMTESMQLIREFCDRFISSEKVTRTRIFFPEASEVDFARQSVFSGCSFKLDYLTKPSFFEDFGFVEKIKMSDRVKTGDELFLVGYPYFNVNEILVVEELYKEAVLNTERKLIIFNGELDRIRSGYYPSFFYPKLAALTKTFLPMMETVYYIHNFKGRNGGTLFRCYPGPWKVLRRVGNRKYVCLHQQNSMPSLKEVALEILPSA